MSKQNIFSSAGDALGFLDSIGITVFMSLCDIVGISDRLADHGSTGTRNAILAEPARTAVHDNVGIDVPTI